MNLVTRAFRALRGEGSVLAEVRAEAAKSHSFLRRQAAEALREMRNKGQVQFLGWYHKTAIEALQEAEAAGAITMQQFCRLGMWCRRFTV